MPQSRAQRVRTALRKQEIIRRVAEGGRLSAVCAEVGTAHPVVCRWVREDSGFAAEMAQARRLEAWGRRWRFDEDRAREILARVTGGEPLTQVLRDPGMPSRATLAHWRATQGWFQGELWRLIAMHRRTRRARNFTYRRPEWDEDLADRALLWLGRGVAAQDLRKTDRTLPSYDVVQAWRRERPDFDADVRVNQKMGRLARLRARRMAALPAVLDGIIAGGSLVSLGGTNGLPTTTTMYRWEKADREFAEAVAQAYEDRDSETVQAMLDALVAKGPGLPAAQVERALAAAYPPAGRKRRRRKG